MITPENIRATLRQRLDSMSEAEFNEALEHMTPMEKLRHVVAWELGYAQWADIILNYAKNCGMVIKGADGEIIDAGLDLLSCAPGSEGGSDGQQKTQAA